MLAQQSMVNIPILPQNTNLMMQYIVNNQSLCSNASNFGTERKKQDNIDKEYNRPLNYRTKPCKNFHSPSGCNRGDRCHFIHDTDYPGVDVPNFKFSDKYANTGQIVNRPTNASQYTFRPEETAKNSFTEGFLGQNSSSMGNQIMGNPFNTNSKINMSGMNIQMLPPQLQMLLYSKLSNGGNSQIN